MIGAQRASCIGWAFSLSAPLAAPFVYVRCVSSDHGQTVKITEVDGCATVLGVRMYYVLVTSFSNVSRPQLHVGLSFLSVVLVAFFFFLNSHHALLDSQQALMWDSWGVALSCAHSCWPLLGQVGVRNCGVCVMHVFGRLWSSQSCSCFVPLHRLAYSFHAVIGFSVWAIVISVKLYSAVFRGGHHGSKNGAQTFCHKVGTTHRDRTVNPF